MLERIIRRNAGSTIERCYGITSLPRSRANAAWLLHATRQHWLIENALHRTLDTALGEDACAVRSGQSPLLLSWLRKLACHLLPRTGQPTIPAAIEWTAANAHDVYKLLTRQNHPPDY